MKTRLPANALIALLLSLAITGCAATWTPKQQQIAANHAFAGSVETVSVAIRAGAFSDDERQQILSVVDVAWAALQAVNESIDAGLPANESLRKFGAALEQIEKIKGEK